VTAGIFILLWRPPPPSRPPSARRQLALIGLALLAVASFGGFWLATSQGDPRDPQTLVLDGLEALRGGRLAEARRIADLLERRRAPTSSDRNFLAEVDLAEDRPDAAIATLRLVPDDDPLGAQARHREGQIELRRNRARLAAAAYRKALALDPKLVRARKELIFIEGYRLRRPQVQEQYAELEKQAALDSQDAFLWCLLRDAAWEPAEASQKLAGWVEADPDDRESRLGLAENLRLMSQFDKAEGTLKPLPEDDDDARVLRARIALDLGKVDLVDQLLKGGSERHLGLAKLRGKQAQASGDLKDAVRWYRIAHELEPDSRDTINGLAQVLTRLDDPEARKFRDAAAKYERFNTLFLQYINAREKRAVTAEMMRKLGAGCEGMGQAAEARTWYRLALEADPLDREAQGALFRLKGAG
jgi:tetratricopeptide (TPR) repeat protein